MAGISIDLFSSIQGIPMKRFIVPLSLLCSISLPALAQHVAETAPASAASSTARPQVAGEIRKIDSAAGKLTIRHADIPNLGMPGMTMIFAATPALLNQVTVGSQILFTADRIDGVLTLMSVTTQ
jgi:Cu(I)/Ag(I) efflux system protein CusF